MTIYPMVLGMLIPESGEDYTDRPLNVPVNSSQRALKNPWTEDLVGYGSWSCKESNTIEPLTLRALDHLSYLSVMVQEMVPSVASFHILESYTMTIIDLTGVYIWSVTLKSSLILSEAQSHTFGEEGNNLIK